MDFFGWVDIPLLFLQLFSSAPSTATPGEIAAISVRQNLICLGIGAGVFILFLILGGLGLNALAQKEGLKKSPLAFIPFLNTYFAGKVAGEANFFGVKMKRAGLYAAISEFFYSVLQGASIVFSFLLTRGEYIIMESIEGTDLVQWSVDPSLIPSDKKWIYNASQYCSYISFALQVVVLVFMIVLFIALFKKYYARSPFLMAFLCTFLPFRGAVLFAVRKNARLDFDDFYRRRQEEYARRNGTYPPYGNPPQGPSSPSGDDPFADYKENKPTPDDPFTEFGQGDNAGKSDDDPFGDV